MTVTIRIATQADVKDIVAIVNHYAAQNLMLWRTPAQIELVLAGFLVAEDVDAGKGKIAGCGSIVELTPQLAEVRSLAVAPDYRSHGLGGQIVAALVEMARACGYQQVCALTLREGFFKAQGFATVDRWALAPKIWHECVYCTKFHACDEIAVLMNLTQPAEATVSRQPLSLPGPFQRGWAWLSSKT